MPTSIFLNGPFRIGGVDLVGNFLNIWQQAAGSKRVRTVASCFPPPPPLSLPPSLPPPLPPLSPAHPLPVMQTVDSTYLGVATSGRSTCGAVAVKVGKRKEKVGLITKSAWKIYFFLPNSPVPAQTTFTFIARPG